jgi:hypothetical protein
VQAVAGGRATDAGASSSASAAARGGMGSVAGEDKQSKHAPAQPQQPSFYPFSGFYQPPMAAGYSSPGYPGVAPQQHPVRGVYNAAEGGALK